LTVSRLLRNWVLAFLAPRPLVGLLGLPRYLRDWRAWKGRGGAPLRWRDSYPCLADWSIETPFDPHYFYQAAWLARRIRAAAPAHHVDIGSSTSMIAVLSAMVDTVHVDYRPLRASLPGLECRAGDILALPFADGSLASLSCLHVLEHIGLGRYGDPVDPLGSEKAAAELARVVAPGGVLYLSVPVGRPRVCFNAHRVFDAEEIVSLFPSLSLRGFALVDDAGGFAPEASPRAARGLDYGCGMFELAREARA
jgi:SAM-dependent methyltransferase